jgi:HD-GYP domain-containing protein (c-di-GMP phosphodiesterase class II)
VQLTSTLLSAPRTSLWWEDDEGWVVPRRLHGHADHEALRVLERRFEARLSGGAIEPFVLGPDEIAVIDADPIDPARSYAIAPLLVDGRYGCIVAALPEGGDFGERELRLLGGLARQANLAIENASNFEGLERTFVSTVEALANALEANDEYTSTHARWITDLALKVGGALGLDDECLKKLELGALLHDIGKIGIPSEILQKPGPLTDEEFEIVKEHPELGEKILAPIDRLADVRPIVRACHERWDGGGYPDGKAGEEIPVEARIVLVCDAFHAMVTDRPYRGRMPRAEAVERLVESAGTQFDPTVVKAFVRLFEANDVLPLD